jgi:TadE-like protein
VEFAISIILVLFFIFCCWELLMAAYTTSVLGDAAKEGVRYAIVHGSGSTLCSGPAPVTACTDADANNVKNRVKDYAKASLHDTSAITVDVSYPDSNNQAPNRVQITVTYTYLPYVNLSFFQPVLRTHAEGRIVN